MKWKDLNKIGVNGDFKLIVYKIGMYNLGIKGFQFNNTPLQYMLDRFLNSNPLPIICPFDEINEILAYNDDKGFDLLYNNKYSFSHILTIILKDLKKKKILLRYRL